MSAISIDFDRDDNIRYNLPLIIRREEKVKRDLRRNAEDIIDSNYRVISKRGRVNIHLDKIPEKSLRYVHDFWNTLVNMRWRWLLVTVLLVNLVAYLLFSFFFYFDAWISGDFDGLTNHEFCIIGVNNFTSFFMLGVETITATGYGYFQPTEHCQLIFGILTFSTLVTIFIDGAFISVVYVKFSKPTIYSNIFSKKCVINMRNGKFCLILRINDEEGKHWINTHINIYFIQDFVTEEGEVIPNYIHELDIVPYGTLFYPVEIVHEIDEASPFWTISAKDLMLYNFEILVVVTGNSINTGQCSKSQTSYLSKEIQWGHRFCSCIEYNNKKLEYSIDKKKFNKVISYDTPLGSPETMDELRKLTEANQQQLRLANFQDNDLT